MLQNRVKNSVEHFLGEAPRLRIIAAAMVAIVERAVMRQRVTCSVMKSIRRWPQSLRHQYRPVGDDSQRENHGAIGHCGNFVAQVRIAAPYFSGQRRILRWQAFHGVGNAAAGETQAVFYIRRHGLIRETEAAQRVVEQDAGVVAGKRPPRPVCTVHAWRQAHDQQPGARRAERAYGPGVVIRVACTHPIEMMRQPRAPAAGFGKCRYQSRHFGVE